jgi:N-acetylneuraminate synthase/N,N'-diacetyllegionaminate synthase
VISIRERKEIKIGRRTIGDDFPTFIVAETGTNHNGNVNIGIKMVEAAKRCGADAIKFQTIDADASYIKGTVAYNIYKKIRFTKNDWIRLKNAAAKNNILFFSAPADIPSVEMLADLDLKVIKISSGSMTNIALVRRIAELRIPVMISTGMAYLWEVKKTVSELQKRGVKDIIILHCTSLYPADNTQLNLNAIKQLREVFPYPVGYSDHTTKNLASIVAVSLGARVIEKHFTLKKSLKGPEQAFSYTPDEFKILINEIRYVEKIFGAYEKKPSQAELKIRDKNRRCLVANVNIKKGQVITEEMIGMKRPRSKPGLNTSYFGAVIGKRAKNDIKKNNPIYSDSIIR